MTIHYLRYVYLVIVMQKYSKTPSTHSCHPVAVLKLNCDFAEEDCSLICTRRIPSENKYNLNNLNMFHFYLSCAWTKLLKILPRLLMISHIRRCTLPPRQHPPTNLRDQDQCLLNINFSAVASGSGVRSTRGKKGSSRLRKVQ